MIQTALKPKSYNVSSPKKALNEIIKQYLIVSLKLLNISEMIPDSDTEAQAIEKQELALLDQQANLLNSALSSEINSLDDAKAILKLWHHEVVQSQMPGDLTMADELVSSVCQYLDVA